MNKILQIAQVQCVNDFSLQKIMTPSSISQKIPIPPSSTAIFALNPYIFVGISLDIYYDRSLNEQ